MSSCFGCLYFAVVDFSESKSVVSTFGTLSVILSSPILVMNFLKAKSRYFSSSVIITSKSSSSSFGSLSSGIESSSSPSSLVISAIFLS